MGELFNALKKGATKTYGAAKATKAVVQKGTSKASEVKAGYLSDPGRYADVPAKLSLMIDRIISEKGAKKHDDVAAHGIKIAFRPGGHKIRITVGGDSKVEGVKAALDKQSFPYEPAGDAKCIIVDVFGAAVKALGYKIEGQED